ncbi:hypothetical protein [Microbacterium sp. XT11]|uniref:hypothetical protein n=1 Tax=Microbacterium sp. XT11 TaxID=367477 RepID=UPI0007430626|nr:hypothetical protein [Microbacterium sp. XT11]ALX67120.1 hypothetical protein AB663_002831 [Microbacterium sp. XT11]
MPRTPDSPVAPRVSPPDLPEHLDDARPARGADLLAARLRLDADADLAYATLEQCTLCAEADTVDLTGATLLDVEIVDSGIRTIDMPLAELTRVRFTATRCDEVDPRGMKAVDVDLRGLDAVSYLDANSLRGATLTSFQVQQLAPMLAAGIGILVTD